MANTKIHKAPNSIKLVPFINFVSNKSTIYNMKNDSNTFDHNLLSNHKTIEISQLENVKKNVQYMCLSVMTSP
jgi:hypothetical protein